MISGKTLIKRDVVNKPNGEQVIRTIGADVEIIATENEFQWLHLIDGGWVNAGSGQQYIKWHVVTNPNIPPDPPVVIDTGLYLITGKTLIKCDVVDKPRSNKVIRTLGANVEITARENRFQWLHLTDGGWVNAGAGQKYIKWQAVTNPNPTSPPSPEVETRNITEIKRKGRIATLLVQWQNPKWGYAPSQSGELNAYPQTVTFNTICDERKGSRIPLTPPILDYLEKLNGPRVKELIMIANAGWINQPTIPPTIERLTWAANHVVVKETKVQNGVEYSNVYASSCYATDLAGTFFDKDIRLIVHKFNAYTKQGTMIKLAAGLDCYTPFITNPDVMNGDMWIRSDYIEMWPDLPFTLLDGSQIVEYQIFGFDYFGIRSDGTSVLLRNPSGFKTNWKINSPEVPI